MPSPLDGQSINCQVKERVVFITVKQNCLKQLGGLSEYRTEAKTEEARGRGYCEFVPALEHFCQELQY